MEAQRVSEEERLKALHALGILDTPPTPEFDAITSAAARLLSAPISLVSLVDRDRQWFKSAHGLDARETPRDASFCSQAIALGEEPMVIPDALKDERFVNNALVTDEPRIRAYAGAPVRGPGGVLIGTVCAIDRKPRPFSNQDVATLKALSRWAELELVFHALGVHEPDDLLATVAGDAVEGPARHRFWDLAPDPLMVLDLQGRILDANACLGAFLGVKPAALRGISVAEMGAPAELNDTLMALAQASASGRSAYRTTLRGADGHLSTFSWEATRQANRLYVSGRLATARPAHPIRTGADLQAVRMALNSLDERLSNLDLARDDIRRVRAMVENMAAGPSVPPAT